MKTLLMIVALGALAPFVTACTNKTVVDKDTGGSHTSSTVREDTTVREAPAPVSGSYERRETTEKTRY